jgi:putative ABC transport system permease protein
VANIMYIVVRERTREIGIRRSVGARSRDILGSFFAETFAIVGLGALFGFGLSVGIVKLLGFVPMQEFVGKPVISAPVLIATVGLLGFIGFLAGLFPARRAAGLDPVECLRT